ncbi:MAG: hypothetical protein QG673_2282 [Pseudomonadota bacterium]|nr:hypothetical protein [Pseudomonadota bacterium]
MKKRVRVLLAASAILAMPLANASLGGNYTTTMSDSATVVNSQSGSYRMSSSSLNSYDVASYAESNGAKVKEYYVNNQVFAVSWSGSQPVNIKKLLGTYFSEYSSSIPSQSSLRMLVINNKNLVVQSYGGPGNYSGVAYVPSLLPSGFDINTLGNLGN